MSLINKLQPLIIILSAFFGLSLGMFCPQMKNSIALVEIFLMLLLFILFLSIDLKQFKSASSNIKYATTSLAINFIITPFIAYLLGIIFFEDSIQIRIGLMMLLVTPCTDWYLVFTKLSGGNVELNLSILPLNLLLQLALLPVYLMLFFSSMVEIKLIAIISSIIMVLVIPFIGAMLVRTLFKNNKLINEIISNYSDILQLCFLCLAVVFMFASEGHNLLENYLLLAKLFIPLLFFFAFIFIIAKTVGNFLNFKNEDTIALHFTCLARNSPIALAITITTFPHEPLIALFLIVGPLLELPILSIVSKLLSITNKN